MALTGSQAEQIQQALLAAFDADGLRRMVKFELNTDLDRIVAPGPLEQRVFDLVDWADRHECVAELSAGALRQNPGHPAQPAAVPAVVGLPTRPLTADEQKVRTRYLEILARDVANRLAVSIHQARFLDIGVVQDPRATTLPWLYQAVDTPAVFASAAAAFAHYRRRLLVLGAPGAGKSTVLLHLAQQLIDEAQQDPGAPIPLLLNLTQFRAAAPASPRAWWRGRDPAPPVAGPGEERVIESWLAEMLAEKYPFVRGELARRWVAEGRVAPLLDGLDEVEEAQRAGLIRQLNASYIDRYPDVPMVVCSRVREYQLLLDRAAGAALHLEGAVTLQPLDGAQIDAYLAQAQAPGLAAALPNDAALYELAQTPLTLSMMTLAYGGMAPAAIPPAASLTERRRHLFDAYIDRMMQRQARREAGIPFDLDPQRDRPTKYSRAQVDRYLGWLAVRLSERQQTLVPPDRLYTFLRQPPAIHGAGDFVPAIAVVNAVVAGLCTLLAGLWLMAPDFHALSGVALFSGAVAVIAWAAAYAFAEQPVRAGAGQRPGRWQTARPYVWVLAVTGLGMLSVVAAGAVIAALAAVVPWPIPPLALGILGTVFIVAGVVILLEDKHLIAYVLLTFGSLLAILAVTAWLGSPGWQWPAVAGAMLLGQLGFFSFISARDGDWGGILRVWGFFGGLLLAEGLGVWWVGTLAWGAALGVTGLALTLAAMLGNIPALFGLAAISGLGSLLGGAVGSVLGMGLAGLLLYLGWSVWVTLIRDSAKSAAARAWNSWAASIDRGVDRYAATPLLQLLLALAGALPFRRRAFYAYAVQILLLKPTGAELEFVHRLLRDHFATRRLLLLLAAGDLERQVQLTQELGLQGEAAVDALTETARRAADPRLRQAAVAGLSRIGTPAAAAALAQALRDPEPMVRRAVVKHASWLALTEAERLWRAALTDSDLAVRLLAWAEMEHRYVYDKPSAGAALDPLGSASVVTALQGDDTVVRRAAAAALGEMGAPSAVPALLAALQDRDTWVRRAAADALREIGDAGAVPGLVTALQDRNEGVRGAAAAALRKIGDARAVPGLLAALQDRDRDVRKLAADALGKIGDAKAVPGLLTALQDRNEDVRRAAAAALGKIGDARAVSGLLTALQDRNEDVRRPAADALGKIGDAKAVPGLLTALQDRNEDVRRAAADALGKIGDARAVSGLLTALQDRNEDVRRAAADALGKIGDARALPGLLTALQDRNEDVRRPAADALGKIGDAKAVPGLLTALQDRDKWVRWAAANALRKIGDARAVPGLLTALQDRDMYVRIAAVRALGRLRDARAVPALQRSLADREQSEYGRERVCDAAAAALAQIGTPEALAAVAQWRQTQR